MYARVESMIQDFGDACAHFAHYELQEPCSCCRTDVSWRAHGLHGGEWFMSCVNELTSRGMVDIRSTDRVESPAAREQSLDASVESQATRGESPAWCIAGTTD